MPQEDRPSPSTPSDDISALLHELRHGGIDPSRARVASYLGDDLASAALASAGLVSSSGEAPKTVEALCTHLSSADRAFQLHTLAVWCRALLHVLGDRSQPFRADALAGLVAVEQLAGQASDTGAMEKLGSLRREFRSILRRLSDSFGEQIPVAPKATPGSWSMDINLLNRPSEEDVLVSIWGLFRFAHDEEPAGSPKDVLVSLVYATERVEATATILECMRRISALSLLGADGAR